MIIQGKTAANIACQSVRNFLGLNYDFETCKITLKNKAREFHSWATKIQMW